MTTAANSSSSAPAPPPPPAAAAVQVRLAAQLPVQKTLKGAANLANLLPTGTVLAFQSLSPSFSNRGTCRVSNRWLTASLVGFCSVVCFLSSFTDSFRDSTDGKLYYGIATWKGLLVFNDKRAVGNNSNIELSGYRMRVIDLIHAWVSLLLFLAFAFCDVNVQSCFFPSGGADLDVLVMNLPLAAGLFATFFFMLFPTTRRGIGYSDLPASATHSSSSPYLPTPTSL